MATNTHHVSSVGEIHSIVREMQLHEDQHFMIKPNTSLNNARELWGLLNHTGGHGVLVNIEVLSGKNEAFEFIQQKLEELRSVAVGADKRAAEMQITVDHLEAVLAGGGPGLPKAFEPKAFRGTNPFVDTDQEIEDADLEGHIDQLKGLMLDHSPGSPTESGHRSAEDIKEREVNDQHAATQFNVGLLRMKQEVLAAFRDNILQGITDLETQFLSVPTHLGSGQAEYMRFEDHPLLPVGDDSDGSDYGEESEDSD